MYHSLPTSTPSFYVDVGDLNFRSSVLMLVQALYQVKSSPYSLAFKKRKKEKEKKKIEAGSHKGEDGLELTK